MLRNVREKLMAEGAETGPISDADAKASAEGAARALVAGFKAAGFPILNTPSVNTWGQADFVIGMAGMRVLVNMGVQSFPRGLEMNIEFQSPLTMDADERDRWDDLAMELWRGLDRMAAPQLRGFGRLSVDMKGHDSWPTLWLYVAPGKERVAVDQFPSRVESFAAGLARKVRGALGEGLDEGAADRPKQAPRDLVRLLAKHKARGQRLWDGEAEPSDQEWADLVRSYAWAADRWTDAEIAEDPRQAVAAVMDVMRERERYAEAVEDGPDVKGIAHEILRQLGGRRFLVMTGARNLEHAPTLDAQRPWPTLRLQFPIGKAKHLAIALAPDDTYLVQFLTRAGRVIGEFGDIYADQLQRLVADQTGLALSL